MHTMKSSVKSSGPVSEWQSHVPVHQEEHKQWLFSLYWSSAAILRYFRHSNTTYRPCSSLVGKWCFYTVSDWNSFTRGFKPHLDSDSRDGRMRLLVNLKSTNKQPHLWNFSSSAAFPIGDTLLMLKQISCPDLLSWCDSVDVLPSLLFLCVTDRKPTHQLLWLDLPFQPSSLCVQIHMYLQIL